MDLLDLIAQVDRCFVVFVAVCGVVTYYRLRRVELRRQREADERLRLKIEECAALWHVAAHAQHPDPTCPACPEPPPPKLLPAPRELLHREGPFR